MRSFITPTLYLNPGYAKLFDLHLPELDISPEPIPPTPIYPDVLIPDELIKSLKNGKCIPIIGPDLFDQQRKNALLSFPQPESLALTLAKSSGYPDQQDVEVLNHTGTWFSFELLKRVCQHYEGTRERYNLIESIQTAFKEVSLPPIMNQLLLWKTPGMFYTYFDGQLAKALEKDREVRIISGVTENLSLEGSLRLLILLRGTILDYNSLILTEEDHDNLYRSMQKIPSQITDLLHKEYGRSLLIIGVSPRDVMVRQLCRQLLKPEVSKTFGQIFIVDKTLNEVDRAYWKTIYKTIKWIEADASDLIMALSARMQS